MKRVALLAYYFPPIGGGGTQRPLTLAKRLPEFGWEPVVVTGPASAGDRWSPRDAGLADGAREVEVVRVAGPEPLRGNGRSERWLRRPSAWSRWWTERAAHALQQLSDIDVVLATLSPFQSAQAAARAAMHLGKPWVADLRDPWALDEMLAYPTRLHRRAELRAMSRDLSSAAAIVMNTAEARAAMADAFPRLRPQLSAPVPNGFEPGDFAVAPAPRSDSAFRIVHTGYLHTDLGRRGARAALRTLAGGTLNGVDIGSRSHLYLVQAIDRLREIDPELGSRIELCLAGVLTDLDIATTDRPYIKRLGFVSHDDSVALLRSADALFLPMHDLREGRRARIVPGKTYEYLAAGRPIVPAVPDGDARDLLLRAGNAAVCRPRDVDGLVDALRQLAAGARPAAARQDVIAPFQRRALTARMAEILDAVADQRTAAAA